MKKILIVFVICCVVALFALLTQKPDEKLHIILCDVGQGDALLIRWGYQQMLIDQGKNDAVLGCLTEHLPFWDRTIEVVIATHADQDHIGGLDDVLKRYHVQHLFMNYTDKSTETLRSVEEIISNYQIERESIYLGDVISLKNRKEVVTYKILSPDKERMKQCGFHSDKPEEEKKANKFECFGEYSEENNRSISGILTFGNFSMLMFGDAESSIEQAVISHSLIDDVDILKVSHHGSKFSTSDEFIHSITPETALISVGKNNRFGHPATRVIDTLRSSNIEILRTDEDGTIEIKSDGQSYWVVR